MSKQSTSAGIRPKLEVLIILVFFLSFIIWAASKCSASGIQDQLSEITEGEEAPVEESEESAVATENPYGPALPTNPDATDATSPTPNTPSGALGNSTVSPRSVPNPSEAFSKLFVTIDGLNMRTGPHLDSTILYKLPLFEEVWFLNEVTDSTQRISLGAEMADEPWVKIKHKKGRVGWVYGAGVNYYRKARLPQE